MAETPIIKQSDIPCLPCLTYGGELMGRPEITRWAACRGATLKRLKVLVLVRENGLAS